LWLPIFPFYRY